LENYDEDVAINIGVGEDVAIKELGELISSIVGFQGEIAWDTSKPDGTPRKLLDISRIQTLGWTPKIKLADGILTTYEWFKSSN
jgi:GDP-L-fucose synthase